MTAPDQLSIETPEQVALEFPLAGVGSRFLALAIDMLLQMTIGLLVLAAVSGAWTLLRPRVAAARGSSPSSSSPRSCCSTGTSPGSRRSGTGRRRASV